MPPVTEVGFVVNERNYSTSGLVWQPFSPQVTITLPGGDGLKYFALSFKDSSGKTNGAEGSSVILDTHGPACWTPSPMTAPEGGTALLRYKVTDKWSRYAKVTITLLREDGTEVRVLEAAALRRDRRGEGPSHRLRPDSGDVHGAGHGDRRRG